MGYNKGRPLKFHVPPGYLMEVRMGQWVEVFEPYWQAVGWTGEVVYIIPANTVPPVLDALFDVSLRATGLKQPKIPRKPSMYTRVVVRSRTGRADTFPLGATSHYFYPASTKEER